MNPGWILALSTLGLVAAAVAGVRFPRAWLRLQWLSSAGLFASALTVLIGRREWDWTGSLRLGGETVHGRLDGVSAFFLVLLSVIGACGALYADGYWGDAERPDSAGRGRTWWSVSMLGMTGVLVAANGLHFLIAWEAFALSAYFLITLDRDRPESRRAGWLYLAASHAGTLALVAFFTSLAARTNGWDLGPWRDRTDLAPTFYLALFGFGVKAGLFPLHFWLPSAHANAPSHVSAMMSAVAIKMGLYGIVRFSGWLPLPPGAAWTVLVAGATSALAGGVFALLQSDLKRFLAYCSVENVGVILLGLGVGMLAGSRTEATWAVWATAGAFLHVWNHGVLKALLFFGAGSVLHATGTREMSRLGGLWRSMPWTTGLFAFGSAALCGLPPLNGFVGEWILYLGLFEGASAHGYGGPTTAVAGVALGVTGALALAGFLKACAIVFLGAPRSPSAAHAHECPVAMRRPMVVLAGTSVFLAIGGGAVWPSLTAALVAWNPAWSNLGRGPDFTSLSLALAGVGCAGFLLAWFLRARTAGRALRRAVTWDCGYAAPTRRMQYTAGSFADLVGGWVRLLVRPEVRLRRPRGPFPRSALRVQRMPETVLERLLEPAGAVFLLASDWVRRRQHGRLTDYVLYLVVGLLAVGALVALG